MLTPLIHCYSPHDCPISFVVIKTILGVNLITYATRRQAGMEERRAADAVNDFGRDPIGEGGDERVYTISACLVFFAEISVDIQQESEEICR